MLYAEAWKEKMWEGIVSVETGYQYFHTYDSVVQGIDILVVFSYSFPEMISKGGIIVNTSPSIGTQVYHLDMFGSFGSTYSVGRKFTKSKLMFDILGLQIMRGPWTFQYNVPSSLSNYQRIMKNSGTVLAIGLNFPLASQYIMDSGFIVGLRHSIIFLLPVTNGENGEHPLKDSILNKRTADYIFIIYSFRLVLWLEG
ncbi:hypothetical protein SAMN02745150_01313 [Brevinema andersonii]|uniref:Uncharacterized protein n=2 Tax=Brevinema andersonii TaxID=34097 RepID=A0A1I1EXU3_BREAD|nr:hypothetical protein SAMN02745150_01313 [Brevinema andersonii]